LYPASGYYYSIKIYTSALVEGGYKGRGGRCDKMKERERDRYREKISEE
jgi:hypothetical protein